MRLREHACKIRDSPGDHAPYRQWLAEGRSIGGGMVEGACKAAIDRRLKQTGDAVSGASPGADGIAVLCCLVFGDQLEAHGVGVVPFRSDLRDLPP